MEIEMKGKMEKLKIENRQKYSDPTFTHMSSTAN